MFASWFRLPRPLIRRVLCAMMDEPMLRALKFDAPPEPLRQVVLVAMRARALLVRMLPRRRTPVLRTLMPHRSYPRGYRIDQLGPR